MDPYETLGVSRTASLAEVRTAWRKMALRTHPDKFLAQDGAAATTAQFQAVQAAFQMLHERLTSGQQGSRRNASKARHPQQQGQHGHRTDRPRRPYSAPTGSGGARSYGPEFFAEQAKRAKDADEATANLRQSQAHRASIQRSSHCRVCVCVCARR